LGTTNLTLSIANDAGTGTTTNKLVKLTATGTAIITTAGDLTGVVGICTSGCGTTGSAQVTVLGLASCITDNATTILHQLIPSSSVNGDCSDAGTTYPTGILVVGQAQETGIAGTRKVFISTDFASANNPGGGKGISVQVNGSTTKSIANFNGTTPAAPGDSTNVTFQTSTSSNTTSVSGYVPLATTNFATTIDYYDDFCSGSSTAGTIGQLGWLFNGGGGNLAVPDGNLTNQSNHPCLVGLLDGAADTSWEYLYPGVHTGATQSWDRIDTYVWYIEAGVNPEGDAGSRIFKSRFGWSATIGAAQPTDGVYFQASFPGSGASPNWFCIVRKGGTETATDSTVAATIATWHYLKISNDGAGTAHFFTGATKAAAVEVCSGMSMTNYPTNIPMRNPVFEIAADPGNGNIGDFVIDWFHLNFTVTR